MAAQGTSEPSFRSNTLERLVGGPIAAALFNRRSEFLFRAKCTVKVTTWNVAAIDGAHRDIGTILRDPKHTIQLRSESIGGKPQSGTTSGIESEQQAEGEYGIQKGRSTELQGGDSTSLNDIHHPERVGRRQGGRVSDRDEKAKGQSREDQDEGVQGARGEIQASQDGAQEEGEAPRAEDSEKKRRSQYRSPGGCIQVICLQEVTDVTSADSFLRTTDERIQRLWQDAIQLVGILMFVFVTPDIASQITTPCSTTVGTGLMGYMGNKGAALGRLVLGGLPAAGVSPPSFADKSVEGQEAEEERGIAMVFINCHLAAFANAVERRNWDYAEIPRRAYFHPKPLPISGGGYEPEAVAASHPSGYPVSESDLVIWAGDLNYRIDLPGNDIRVSLHKFLPPEADGSDPPLKISPLPDNLDTADDDREGSRKKQPNRGFQETISYLLEYDQLREQQRKGKAFQFFHEGQITFLPTYKYDPDTISTFDTSEKLRAPSYCDRVLWKDWKVEKVEIERLEARDLADARDRKRESHLQATENSDILFEVSKEDVEEDGTEEPESAPLGNEPAMPPRTDHEVTTINEIDISDVPTPLRLQKYTSYQSITSSDHKPVVAEFSLEYLAVDQEQRSQIQIEIVKELDRHENETRPAVTVIVESDPNNEMVDFGDVTWDQVVRRTVTIANTGRTPATCEFVKRPVLPSAQDDDDDSGFTKVSSSEIEDPLAFGEDDTTASEQLGEEVCREWISVSFNSLTDRDESHDEDNEELSRISTYARQALKRWIRDALDCDTDWAWDEVDKKGYSEEDKCEVMAECLLDWLDYLKEGVVPASLYLEVVRGAGGKAGADKILDLLPTAAPPVHANVFVYLTGFVAEIISLLSPKHDAAISSYFPPNLSPTAIARRLSGGGNAASSRLTTTELVKRNILKEFSLVIVRKPKKLGGWRSENVERREEERRVAFLAAFIE
ncbi:hypothetical protein ABW19_dt0204462 [Dactylella cylindrospora]|nr:hypothetical protein ABW19_dt0204462 [Dactylella cylindrospora]